MADISALLGVTCTKVENINDEIILFTLESGKRFKLYHEPDCCESVRVEDIIGDLDDLVGSPLTMAEEVTSRENPPGVVNRGEESFTWTFYKFATAQGYVTIRWYGESNGYYSESVDFHECDDNNHSVE